MKKLFTIILWVHLFSVGITAQRVTEGTIRNGAGQPVADASLILRQASDSAIVAYTFSDAQGDYTLSHQSPEEQLILSVAGFNIVAQSRTIGADVRRVDFMVEEKNLQIREVVVKATKIWGTKDTINYSVASFSAQTDVVIGDVLKKMPGINVSEEGNISYQGNPINVFYIENLDMLGGRYRVATNNVSARDVATVQVYENHQPIKAMEGIKHSDAAAINLKLKDSAKGALSMVAQLGLGATPLLFDNSLSAMYFSSGTQNMTVYKGNNAGVNLMDELVSRKPGNMGEVLNIRIPSPPSIRKNRYLFNNSHAGTVNHLFKTGDDSHLVFNLAYYNDHEKRSSRAVTSYYLPGDSLLTIDEAMAYTGNTDLWEAEVQYKKNEEREYMENTAYIQGAFQNQTGDVRMGEEIRQRLHKPSLQATNRFHWLRKDDEDKGFRLQSFLGYNAVPQTLTVVPGLFESMLNDGQAYASFRQEARSNQLQFNNTFTLLSPFRAGGLSFHPRLTAEVEKTSVSSEMYVGENLPPLEADSLKNRLAWMKYAGGAGIDIQYQGRSLQASLALPVRLMRLDTRDRGVAEHYNRIYFQPELTFKYPFSGQVDLNGAYAFTHQTGDIYSGYTGYIMQDYRLLNRYDGRLLESSLQYGHLGLRYKDVLRMFFMNAGVHYNHIKRNMLQKQAFEGINAFVSSVRRPNSTEVLSLQGGMGKGFYWMNLVVSLDVTYGLLSSEQLRQEQLLEYNNRSLNVTGRINGKPAPWLLFNYQGVWGENRTQIEGEEPFRPLRVFVNQISFDVLLPHDIRLNLAHERYYNSYAAENRNLSFTDLSVKYALRQTLLSLAWENIFNTKTYISAYNDGINSNLHRYAIRGSYLLFKIQFKLK